MNKEIKKVAIYYRVSTEGQVEAETIENQKQVLPKYARDKGWTVVAEFEDPGLSGDLFARPEFQGMLTRIQNQEFDAVLVFDFERLTRLEDEIEQAMVRKAFRLGKTFLASPREGVQPPPEQFSDKVIWGLKQEIAAEEKHKIKARFQAGRYRASREGRYSAGQINYGMTWNGAKKKWRIDRDEYFVLREIVRLLKAGYDLKEIAKIFNSDLDKHPLKYTARWNPENISSKIQSDFLFTGERTFKTDEDELTKIRIVKTPFFDKEEVLEVRRILDKLKRKRKPRKIKDANAKRGSFLLAGLATCSCGKAIYIQDFTPSGRPHTYYRCRDSICKLRLNSKKVDSATWKIFLDIKDNPKAVMQATLEEDFVDGKSREDLAGLRDGYEKRKSEIEEELTNVTLLWKKTWSDKKALEKEGTKLEEELVEVENELRRVINTLNLPSERDKAVERATRIIQDQANLVEQVKRLADFEDLDYTEKQKRELEKLIKKSMYSDLDRIESAGDVEEFLFAQKRKLLDELVLTEGAVELSKDRIKIVGLMRLDSDQFTKSTLGQATFG